MNKDSLLKNVSLRILLALLFTFPHFAYAQTNGPRDLQGVVQLFIDFNLILLIPIAFTLGLLYFMWRGATYIFHADSEEGKTEGKRILTWGVIALFIMSSFWGIIKLFELDLIGTTSPTEIPVLDRRSR